MPIRAKKRPARAAVKTKVRARKANKISKPKNAKTSARLTDNISAAEVDVLERQAAQQAKSESAWLNMTAPPPGDDRWSALEENLLDKDRSRDHSERRWKYFAK